MEFQAQDNTSGQGAASVLPEGVKGWSWGAFLLNWIWGLSNKTWISLLCLIPYVNLVMMFVLGFKGREWAWRNKKWNSLEHFNHVQRLWSKVGVFLVLGCLVLAIALVVLAVMMGKPMPAATISQ
jgi:hypothetical protein